MWRYRPHRYAVARSAQYQFDERGCAIHRSTHSSVHKVLHCGALRGNRSLECENVEIEV